MSTQMWLVVIISAIAFVVPLIGSFTICVPKWWDRHIEPHVPEWVRKETDISRWYFAPARWAGAVLRFVFLIFIGLPVLLIGGSFIRYCFAWSSWIGRKCPYTTAERGESLQKKAGLYHGDWLEALGNCWKLAIGRG